MLLALFDLWLALELKGFSQWDARTKAAVCIVGGVLSIVIAISFVRKVGIIAILIPVFVFGSIFVMNKNSGCLEKMSEVPDADTGAKKPGVPSTKK